MRGKLKIRHVLLIVCLSTVWATQLLPGWGDIYAQFVYPTVSRLLSSFSRLLPFAVGDLFIFLSIAGLLLYPFYARHHRGKKKWKPILLNEAEYLLWLYAWFYLAWGLNYSQKDFHTRTGIPYTAYTPEVFQRFADSYINRLNASYTDITTIDKPTVCRESVQGYRQISDTLGVHRPPRLSPRAKTMLFTPLTSMVGITGSMGPFFCEFTLNGDLLPSQYPATYAHELAHLLGITSEAEANFYAYQVCTRSPVQAIRFSGYLSILSHVLMNARLLMDEEAYTALTDRIRPEIKTLYLQNRAYWMEKYSPLVGEIQNFIYDLYLKGNRIQNGRKNYSEVIGLLISYEEAKRTAG
ncbi:DUF3810 domain-containing protein [Bacteroides sp.]|uniref:DUF3810 domain-containing protein n=1 Tax=Bacteroides sp. TaxID=29523 RepID=UPI0023CE13D7|nr:DUF3810 domain-containing protein [Bacteroides sp.]MDE6216197.1 DUF3810 domain-containing protein [Bacteroides sp.]